MSARRFRERSMTVEAIQWTGNNFREISEWMAAARAFGHLSVSVADDELVLHKPGLPECLASVGDWVIRFPGLHGEGSDWAAQSAAEFGRAYEEAGPVQQLRDIAGQVIGGNNPNLADVLNELAGWLERDMAAPEVPIPEPALAYRADLAVAVQLMSVPDAFTQALKDRLSAAAGGAP